MKILYPILVLLALLFIGMAIMMCSAFWIAKYMDSNQIDRGWLLIPFALFGAAAATSILAATIKI